MARLHEYEGKAVLAKAGIAVPRGQVARSADEAKSAARAVGFPCVVKIQAWMTGRASIGGVAFAENEQQAAEHAARMLAMKVGQFPVGEVLIEEKLSIAREFFVSLAIDDRERCPVLLISASGGSGVEERAGKVAKIVCDVHDGPRASEVEAAVAGAVTDAAQRAAVRDVIVKLFAVARSIDARSLEVNPLVVTASGAVVAADCRVTVDDYAVFRHPELGIEIARELDHPPTELEKIAYRVEQEDHRGTFFFAQMNTAASLQSESQAGTSAGRPMPRLIGFHGAGGGGSMMSMDAITAEGFTIANFCDTSGNPSPAKVYRAARIILSQPGLVGYFGSGSGVANQEQYWSAYGLAKAFWEMDLDVPAVIRLGGNTEDRAVEILQGACKAAGLRATVEGYKKGDSPAKIAGRFAELVGKWKVERGTWKDGNGADAGWEPRKPRRPAFVGASGAVKFAVKGGRVWIDGAAWKQQGAAIIARSIGLLRDDGGKPGLAVKPEEFMTKDSDMIACEVECRRDGIEGVFVELEISGLEELMKEEGIEAGGIKASSRAKGTG